MGLKIEIKATGRLRECVIDWLAVWVLDFSLSLRNKKSLQNQDLRILVNKYPQMINDL
jgi:hypothetical protein